jgi:hypothetical protein
MSRRSYAFVSLLGLGLLSGGGGVASLASGCGGCLWVNSSAIDERPLSSCLEVAIDRADQDSGCAQVVLTGRNRCDQPFVILARPGTSDQATTIAPGARFDAPLAHDYPIYSSEADAYRFDVACTLGGKPLTLSFSTWL